jgi:hypothetical protein
LFFVMGYIDKQFYDEVFNGTPIDEEAFAGLEMKASNAIDSATNYRLTGKDLQKQPIFIQDNLKMAVAAQMEFMNSQGGGMLLHGSSPASVSIGGFSYSEGGSGAKALSEMAYGFLSAAGLLYMGVSS